QRCTVFVLHARGSTVERQTPQGVDERHETRMRGGGARVAPQQGSVNWLPRTPPRCRAAQPQQPRSRNPNLMTDIYPLPRPSVPLRALGLSVCALAVPVIATAVPPDVETGSEPLLWLLAL